ncbi:hypothetical protein PHSY_003892 [Pseudozyma hubeiensis SY62]|uniref:Uncharacterized protein n=1 Tax=Pseudozyma hubeiensis (strain SY62) TaxID=1305764 RepID=R9P515_PSEHS|nr:hypothetical protein PHSY_003892 [Pseudozyma hubeiensis SY62]GAC96312.1 hypothetical protein PHSY_003892 [Pseudozyma hubeiensis SY62]
MSEERTGEVAAAQPPPSEQQAVDNAEQHVGPVDASATPDHQSVNDTGAQQSAASHTAAVNDEALHSTITASTSERDVEALTALHERAENLSDNSATASAAFNLAAAASSSQMAGIPAKKFTSLNVNKRFLEKASPTPSVASPATLKLGTSASPLPTHRLSSPSATSRLTSAKLSSVPKPQPAGWATTKPATAPTTKTAPSSQPPALAESTAVPAPASDATPAAPASADPLPAEASAPLPKAAPSPKPSNLSTSQAANGATAAVASPRLVSMGRDSPRPGSAGLDSGSGQGRASPGLRNAALGSSLRAPSPANVSRAPWAGVKSGLSPHPPSTRGTKLSDFPTAAEAARAKQEQEERAAAAAARESARQQAALQALDRFRGTSLGSGKHWDEMEDEDGGFLGEVVEFGDGSQYKIPTSNDGSRGEADDGPPVSKEDRFKDVSHDRSWPQRDLARPAPTAPAERARPAAAQPPAWGPMKNREMATSTPNESSQPSARPSRSEQRAEKVIIPTTGASVSLRSPTESRDVSGFSYGRERRPGLGATPYGGRQEQSGPPPSSNPTSTQAARSWGPLAQRQASLNPGSAPPPVAPTKAPTAADISVPRVSAAPTTAVPEPARAVAPLPSAEQQQQQQQQQQSQSAPQPIRERHEVPAREPQTSAAKPLGANGRPLPPHLLVAGSGDSRPPMQATTNRPLPPHLAQNLRPAVPAQAPDSVGRKTSHAYEEVSRPDVTAGSLSAPSANAANRIPSDREPSTSQSQQASIGRTDSQPRAPWGPKAMAQTRIQSSADAPERQPPPPTQVLPPSSEAVQEEDVHASIERARKRRQEEEQARLAERERARQKALAIEDRIRAAQQQKEAEAQAAAQKQAVEAKTAAIALASEDSSSLRKSGPADSVASWRTARPEGFAAHPDFRKARQQQAPVSPTDRIVATSATSPSEQIRDGRTVSSQRAPRLDDERILHRRDQRTAQYKDQHEQRSALINNQLTRSGLDPESEARFAEFVAKAQVADAPKTILSRPVKQASAPATPSAPEIRVDPSAPRPSTDARSQKIADRSTSRIPSASKPKDAATQDRSPRIAAATSETPAVPVAAPVPVRLHPVVPKESLETRQEAALDAPPAWNRFVVHLKPSRPRPKLNRYQQKQLFARIAAMKASGRAVYPLTWDPPLAHLSFKTLSRDDQLFPKRYHRGTVIAPVKLPSRVLPRGLPPIVPHIMSQTAGPGSRKQARFDLTAHQSEAQSASGLGSRFAADAPSTTLSPASQIQVRLPGHHGTVVQPHAGGHVSGGLQADRRDRQVDATTDAIIGEVLSSGAPQSAFDDRTRAAFRTAPAPAAAAPGSLGPLDYPQNGYSVDSFGSQNGTGAYRAKGRRGSNAAVAFYDERQVSTPSPVSFMVNSEIKGDAAGARGSLSPFAIPGSTRASQTQTPASAGSMLPSPSMSTQGTWGQSSLTFPVLETRSSNLADRDHIKSVWSLTTNSNAGELQNSLKDIGDDFMPTTLPMSVHDFRADDGHARGAQDDNDSWATFNRYQQQQQYSRGQHEMSSHSRDLSPVNSRSNGFDPTSRSPALGMDASAAAAARAREAGQHYSSVSQQASNAYSSLNGGGYGQHQTSSYSPLERQQDGGSGLGKSAFGAYSGYGGGASGNQGSSVTTDALYSTYSAGSMTPNRQSYGQYGSHASTARSAPGSPYGGMSRHAGSLNSGVSGYSLFPTGGSGTSTSNNVGSRNSQTSNGMDGLGVLDDTAFGTGRSQFYGARGYPSQQQQQSSSQQNATGASGTWPTSATGAGGNSSISVAGSVLRPAASVFNPSKYTAQRASQSQQARLGQHTSPASQQQLQSHHHAQSDYSLDPTPSSNSVGPIDQRESGQYGQTTASGGAYGSGAGYSAFSTGAGVW